MLLLSVTMLGLLLATSASAAPSSEPLVAAIYFGDWHVDPQMAAVHGAIDAQPLALLVTDAIRPAHLCAVNGAGGDKARDGGGGDRWR